MKPKICVYAIALDERKFADRFMASCRDADLVLVCDTGSIDGTAQRLRELGATVHQIEQKPWRFDEARNKSLDLIPPDFDLCVCLDLDEVLQPGWRGILNDLWHRHSGRIDRLSYDFVWSWLADATPDIRFNADKIHSRHGWRWRHPCHETLHWQKVGEPVHIHAPGLQIQHHPDPAKSRAQYLPLLELAVREEPQDDRMRHYYARELMFSGCNAAAIEEFHVHLSLASAQWKEERAASWRYISRCERNLGRWQDALASAIRGALEWPHTREPWLEVARAAYGAADWSSCHWGATKCLTITRRTGSYMGSADCWGAEPYDLAALAAYNSGLFAQAVAFGRQAVAAAPADRRLSRNLAFYLAARGDFVTAPQSAAAQRTSPFPVGT